MRTRWLCLFLPCLCCSVAKICVGQVASAPATLDAQHIMAAVAANQDRSEQERSRFVYLQHSHISSRKGKSIRCEETTDFRVTPSARGTAKQLLKLDGRILLHGQYLQYDKLPGPHAEEQSEGMSGNGTMDRDLVENLRDNLTGAPSKDGLGANLFPLTSKNQAEDKFQLLGRESRNGHDTFHITFRPRDKEDYGWKGEAWIDTASLQPVVVRTSLSRKLPLAVRSLLGTNLPGLGFTVIYAPQEDGVWFPVSFGTEFKLDVLFFLRREVTLSVENRDFEKTHVQSHIIGASGTGGIEMSCAVLVWNSSTSKLPC